MSMQKQRKSSGSGPLETADDLAGNKDAGLAADHARAILQQTKAVKHYRCGSGSCKATSQRADGVCRPVAVYED